MHLVARGHFRSHDKDGPQTIRSAVVENTRKPDGSIVIAPELWAIEFYIAGIEILDVFGSCDLDLPR